MFENLIHKITSAKINKQPFVVYNDPGSNRVKALFQKDDQLHYQNDFKESGFIFAPFDNSSPSIIFQKQVCENIIVDLDSDFLAKSISKTDTILNVPLEETDIEAKKKHIALVNKGIEFLNENKVAKVVLSRKEDVILHDFEISELFLRLLQKYPLAFVYVWYHPKVGLWMGASPETLVAVKNNQFTTMALAGTQIHNGELVVKWGAKEVREQQFVTDFIVEQLKGFDLEISKPFTKKAGSLLHICTLITGKLSKENKLKGLIEALHPTPAVCGLPKEKAKTFIIEKEAYHREFYTGYMGALNMENKTNLFVNLRCMQMKDQKASLYIGGGITKESDPESEWEETVAKSKVMKQVLL